MAYIQHKTTIITKAGRKYPAILKGERGGDVGEILVKFRGKYMEARDVAKYSKPFFPVIASKKTPFIDIGYVGEKIAPRKKEFDVTDSLTRMLG